MNFDPATIKAGDWLVPCDLVNRILFGSDPIPNPACVIKTESHSENGVIFSVNTAAGNLRRVNHEWFTDKVEAPR